jgi:predicted RNase H-like HicB family nuclease
MSTEAYTFWKDGDFFLGFLNTFPDFWTQAYSVEELVENLRSLRQDLDEFGIEEK